MVKIISQLFINSTIMISSLMLANMVMQERLFNKSLKNSIINGLLSGLLGGVLMIYGAEIAPNIIIDFRFIPIILMGLYVSFSAAIETAVIIGALRIADSGLN
jgi:diguanylate cyclase